jgi:hypothetical protein
MKLIRTTSTLVLLAATAFAAQAQTAKTRDDVKAEWAEAQRTGNLPADGESGLLLRELHPQLYPQAAARGGRTRDEVKAEFADAVRSGAVIASAESGLTLQQQYPERYPPAVRLAGKSREEVKAETLAAIRNGDLIVNGELGLRLNELHPGGSGRVPHLFARRGAADVYGNPAAVR